MTDRPSHAPMFTREHGPQPHETRRGELLDGGGSVSGRQPVPASGLDRVQSVGGYDGLAHAADDDEAHYRV
jgi:hypothetical protein